MHKSKQPSITKVFPDLSVADLDQLPRGRAGYAQLKKLEERPLEARRELDAKLEVISRAKPTFENWMDLELAAAHTDCTRSWTRRSPPSSTAPSKEHYEHEKPWTIGES